MIAQNNYISEKLSNLDRLMSDSDVYEKGIILETFEKRALNYWVNEKYKSAIKIFKKLENYRVPNYYRSEIIDIADEMIAPKVKIKYCNGLFSGIKIQKKPQKMIDEGKKMLNELNHPVKFTDTNKDFNLNNNLCNSLLVDYYLHFANKHVLFPHSGFYDIDFSPLKKMLNNDEINKIISSMTSNYEKEMLEKIFFE